ncbi:MULTISPECIES: flagellar biosynthesis protein FlhF [unclassified Cupriavidus]|uniref:flagellar biosynthesis protein FlhF n=1 Tax=unclassified Cupriavidus TaxID=2640874 RepID=UPI001C003672|nr:MULTISPECIES: flagellar biosynthesis protein FlhF [unclassified Cupriavidus]MCA3191764.1 flagellar biosynthesis protein FlhF [Cupriavidus sp.]MCA3197994.1 flagellar biosynthesis protein FlhF [Cupriavidus sp.]MCA3200678.1 flagellar biosynthesis protein FlhF [Cupriavidus sp.]MCA3207358.1 flagellar biosynthesis protein FlhF [Cupriavidus sp.]MCA3233960.1 flagellar biosynthesis protein FlhF [Cupriavidus sp.]
MSVAKFVAANGREAMRKVREAMGPDAVVLSNRSIDGGVEIVAMRDADLGAVSAGAQLYPSSTMASPVASPSALPMLQSLHDMHPASPQPFMPLGAMPAPAMGQEDPMLGDLRGELASMRSMLERQFAGLSQGASGVAAGDPLRESLFEWMVNAGFSGQLSRTLLSRLPVGTDRPAAMAWIRQELASKVPVLSDEDSLFAQGGVLALIGPTGVGKTTTTAKLAARFVLRHGPQSLALLTTDRFRIGAHEQLRIYGDILGVPVHAVKDAADLRFALSAMKDKHLVIIDTVGMSQRDRSLSDQIGMLAGVQAPMQRVLLLNGAAHGDTLNEVVHAYRNDAAGAAGGIDGCIISKLDEATHLGSVLDVVIRHRLPVFYASTGQRVPEHLELAQAGALVERAFLTPRRGSLFNDADVARRQAGSAEPAAPRQAERSGADDMLRSLTDSANAVGVCVDELNAAQYGFDVARQLWQHRTAGVSALRPMVQQVRLAMCRDASRACDRYVLAVTQSVAQTVQGRRAPQMMQHTLWLADRDGMPLASTVVPVGKARQSLAEAEADAEAATVRATLAAARTVVNLNTSLPGTATLARWQQLGERWVAGTRKTTRVIAGGLANKLDTIADTLTFHAAGDVTCRDRAAAQWLAHCLVRIPEGQVRTAARGRGNAAEAGIEACLVVSRMIDHETGDTLAVEYMLCDPALADDAAQVARWSQWTIAAEEQFRTLRHATEHFAQEGDADASLCAGMVAVQLGLTALRLQHTPTPTAPAFLSRLAGRASARVNAPVPGAVLNEGMGRLLALLDVLENYPGRGMAAAAPMMEDAPQPAASAMHAMEAMDAMEAIDATPQLAAAGE